MSLSTDEEVTLELILKDSEEDPTKPDFPPGNAKFPATPTRKLEVKDFKNIFVKDESINPTGTFKDRFAWKLVRQYKNLLLAKKEGMARTGLNGITS